MTNTEKILEEFDDYFFEATRGRNDVRREKITSALDQALAEEREMVRDAIDKMETTTPEDILSGRDTFVGTFVFVDKSKLKTYLK